MCWLGGYRGSSYKIDRQDIGKHHVSVCLVVHFRFCSSQPYYCRLAGVKKEKSPLNFFHHPHRPKHFSVIPWSLLEILGFAVHKVYCLLREGCKKIHMKSLVFCLRRPWPILRPFRHLQEFQKDNFYPQMPSSGEKIISALREELLQKKCFLSGIAQITSF